jgi:hypothetical protein
MHSTFSAPLRLSSPKLEIIDQAFDELGPTPRLCLETAFDPEKLASYKSDIEKSLNELTMESLEQLLDHSANLTMDEI